MLLVLGTLFGGGGVDVEESRRKELSGLFGCVEVEKVVGWLWLWLRDEECEVASRFWLMALCRMLEEEGWEGTL